MRLKNVRISGFKTFADRTEVSLEGGIIAVVGPNGCGKSNLVDAILWGLGEGNSRNLRAQSGADVIFNGSAHRRPVGLAEVILTFDNEDGSLPIPTSEVTISRRISRGGDSEYAINKSSCRLRDLHDLLADSGLGRAGYAIVGQKEIDSALSASAEERRAWIDEAAGVQRFRMRKAESLRRLSASEEHLSRVTDIVEELRLQREPLEEEAKIAAVYKRKALELRSLEIGLFTRDVIQAEGEIRDSEQRIADSNRIVRDESLRADQADQDSHRARARLAKLDIEIDSIRERIKETTIEVQQSDTDLRLATQKLEILEHLEESLATDDQANRLQMDELRAEFLSTSTELRLEIERLEDVRSSLAGASERSKEAASKLSLLESSLVEARTLQNQAQRQLVENQHRAARNLEIKRELIGIQNTLPDLLKALEDSQGSQAILTIELARLEDQRKQLEASIEVVKRQADKESASIREHLNKQAAIEGRRRGIEATILSHEGIAQGPKAVLEAADRGILQHGYVPVASAVEVTAELATAIDMALGAAANDLIVDHEEAAKAAISWLKDHRFGRATFQPISLMRGNEPSEGLRRILPEQGVVGRASDLVRCNPRHAPVIESLLGRVVIVETVDDALRLARSTGWSRLISLQGEVVHASGAVTGGTHSKVGFGMIQRKAELNTLETELKNLQQIQKSSELNERKLRDTVAQSLDKVGHLREKIAEQGTLVTEADEYVRTLDRELKATQKSQEKLHAEAALLSTPILVDDQSERIRELEVSRDSLLRELATLTSDQNQAVETLSEAEHRILSAQIRKSTAEKRLTKAEESNAQRQRRLESIEPQRATAQATIQKAQKDNRNALQQKAKYEADLELLKSNRETTLDEIEKRNQVAKSARESAAALGESVLQAELKKARAETRRATSLQRLAEEFNITEITSDSNIPDLPADATGQAQRIRRDLRAMGDVNLGAIEAYERLTDRLNLLEAQRSDIQEGIESVMAGILELDKLTETRFITTFDAVNIAFREIFLDVFEGGEGALRLTDPDSILESGIEIEVQLPGKRRQTLNLLSGGERSLCATAFLFALLRVKPSPLVVLDEVDAPLDGRNVERFADLLERFVDQTQFILITHNPTTISRAPVWLGVTMQEPGVSSIVITRAAERLAR